MAGEHRPWRRQREDFWRAHHEAWKLSDLNQREYCEAHRLPRKGFENWRQKFRVELQPPVRKLLYRRSGLSHSLKVTPLVLGFVPLTRVPIVPPARESHRRRFTDADKRRILEEAAQPDATSPRSRAARCAPSSI